MYRSTQAEHNHEWIESDNNLLFHPDSDPRILADSCPACAEMIRNWDLQVRRMMAEGV